MEASLSITRGEDFVSELYPHIFVSFVTTIFLTFVVDGVTEARDVEIVGHDYARSIVQLIGGVVKTVLFLCGDGQI